MLWRFGWRGSSAPLFSADLGDLPGATQAQHVFCILAAIRVAHAGLTCEKRLEALALQAFQNGDGRDIRITRTARGVLVVAKDAH